MVQSYTTLFFGMPFTAEFQAAIDSSKMHLYQLYLKEGYFEEMVVHGIRYIGKPSDELIELQQLISMQEHIYSLLKNVAPNFPFNENPLQLIPVRNEHS